MKAPGHRLVPVGTKAGGSVSGCEGTSVSGRGGREAISPRGLSTVAWPPGVVSVQKEAEKGEAE